VKGGGPGAPGKKRNKKRGKISYTIFPEKAKKARYKAFFQRKIFIPQF